MSIFDYCKDLKLFDDYELSVIEMFIKEYNMYEINETIFLKDINIRKDVELFWYRDGNDNVLGGFHALSPRAVYIDIPPSTNDKKAPYTGKMGRIIYRLPVIIHELCHFYQMKKLGPVLYFIVSLPLIRNFTIEKQAYLVEDKIIEIHADICKKSDFQCEAMKVKHGFSKNYFDGIAKKKLKEKDMWPYDE